MKVGERPVVYVCQDLGNKDLSPALEFGDIKVIRQYDVPVYGDTFPVTQEVGKVLEDLNPDTDFILPTGDPVLIGLVFSVIAQRSRKVKVLKWDRQRRQYWPITLNL